MHRIYCTRTGKRVDSTALPPDGEPFDVLLKEPVSMLRPVFRLKTSSFDYNMVRWGNRYYWVTDVIFTRNDWVEVHCAVDPLASWRSDIMKTSAYVLYSASSWNQWIPDERLMKEGSVTEASQKMSPLAFIDPEGCYVLGVVGKQNVKNQAGMSAVYMLTQDECSDLSVAFSEEGGIWEKISQQFADAFGALLFCRWIPVQPSGNDGTISIMSFNTGVTGKALQERYYNTGFNTLIPWFSEDFRAVEPYSQGYLFLPFVGVVELALSALQGKNGIYISVTLDKITGDIVYKLGGDASPIAVYSGNCAVDVPISSYQRDWKGVVQGGVSTAINLVSTAFQAGAAAIGAGFGAGAAGASGLSAGESAAVAGGKSAMGGVGGLLGNFANTALSYATFNTGSKGGISGGCGIGLGLEPVLTVVTHNTSQAPASMASVCGRPCGRTLSMAGLSGYVQTASFKMGGGATQTEKDMVESMMMGGVYLE